MLGIEGPVATEPEELSEEMTLTVFPLDDQDASEREQVFARRVREALEETGVEVVPWESVLEAPPWKRWLRWLRKGAVKTLKDPIGAFTNGDASDGGSRMPGPLVLKDLRFGPKVRPGTTVLAVGEGEVGEKPVDYMGDFRDVNIVTVLDQPDDVEEEMPFTDHYGKALELFVEHMTNVVVGVGDEQWFIYNFNGSHPFYDRGGDLTHQLLHSLVPKLAAPIRPPRLENFDVREEAFDPTDDTHGPIVDDLIGSGDLLEQTGLYPEGRDLDELPWKNHFYRWATRLHLDDRSGMSYGFLARQMPTDTVPVWPAEEATERFGEDRFDPGQLFWAEDGLHAALDTPEGVFVLPVPSVRMMTLRSGCDKTNPDPDRDLVKLGLEDGQMIMETPIDTRVEDGYRPSFDTQVILAHGVGNVLAASLLEHLEGSDPFADHLRETGMALGHWHGYLHPDAIPEGYHAHGADKPHVSCGTPQSAIFALEGKLSAFGRALAEDEPFRGDVHIEPQHGTNVTFPTLEQLGRFLNENRKAASLGNKFLDEHKERTKIRATA